MSKPYIRNAQSGKLQPTPIDYMYGSAVTDQEAAAAGRRGPLFHRGGRDQVLSNDAQPRRVEWTADSQAGRRSRNDAQTTGDLRARAA